MCNDIQNNHLLPYFWFSTLAKGFLKSSQFSCHHLAFSKLVHVQTDCTYVLPYLFKFNIINLVTVNKCKINLLATVFLEICLTYIKAVSNSALLDVISP